MPKFLRKCVSLFACHRIPDDTDVSRPNKRLSQKPRCKTLKRFPAVARSTVMESWEPARASESDTMEAMRQAHHTRSSVPSDRSPPVQSRRSTVQSQFLDLQHVDCADHHDSKPQSNALPPPAPKKPQHFTWSKGHLIRSFARPNRRLSNDPTKVRIGLTDEYWPDMQERNSTNRGGVSHKFDADLLEGEEEEDGRKWRILAILNNME